MDEEMKITVEIKSVNHRFLEPFVKLPRKYSLLEERIKDQLRNFLNRGRIDIWIGIEELSSQSTVIKLDKNLAIDYYNSLRELAKLAGISEEISVYELCSLEGVVSLQEQETDLELIFEKISVPFQEALEQLVSMRGKEGDRLGEELQNRAEILSTILSEIEARTPEVEKNYRARLQERISSFAEGIDVDPNRLATEIAVFAEKSDITEEIVRFKSHLNQLEESIKSREPVGRKMDFLMQELNREINTIGSKSPDLKVSQKVVEAKSEIEKMREQVQNIE
jgi:uncharacterized protein (TIGR00255 family)